MVEKVQLPSHRVVHIDLVLNLGQQQLLTDQSSRRVFLVNFDENGHVSP